MRFGAASFGTQAGVDGDGIIAWIEIAALATGDSEVMISDLQATSPDAQNIPVLEIDGSVESRYRSYIPSVNK